MHLPCVGFRCAALWQAAAWGRTQLHTGDAVCADTLRLHIRAASDSVADQNAKLRVRDAVLACLDAACAGNQTDARSWAARNLCFCSYRPARAGPVRGDAPVQVQLVKCTSPPGGIPAAAARRAVRCGAHRHRPAAGKTGGACCTPGCAVPPAAAMPCREENDLVCGDYILRLRFVELVNRHTASRTTRCWRGVALPAA